MLSFFFKLLIHRLNLLCTLYIVYTTPQLLLVVLYTVSDPMGVYVRTLLWHQSSEVS